MADHLAPPPAEFADRFGWKNDPSKATLTPALADRVGPGHWLVTITPLPATETGVPVRDHSAFLNSYVAEDEGLYDDDRAR